jgi:hypothetical protein
MVTDLRSHIVLILVSASLSLMLAGASNVKAQPNGMQSFFSAEYGGVSIIVDASEETVPGGNITVAVVINATADGVRIEYLNAGVYGFINGRQQVLLNSTTVMAAAPLQFNETTEFENTIIVPTDVWGITYGQISLRYAIKDLPSTERNPGFPLTTVRNVHLERLESQLQSLNQSHGMLSEIFKKLTTEYEKLNATYTGLLDARAQDSNELYGTRTVATILTITTVFFVATTLYLAMRRSKDYW